MRLWRISLLLCFLTQASGQQVTQDYDRSVDMKAFKTYGWVNYEKPPVYRVSKEDNPEVTDEQIDILIVGEVDRILQKKGFQKVSDGEADFMVSYMAMARYDLGVGEYDPGAAGLPRIDYGHWRPFYQPGQDTKLLRRGTLTLDVVDPKTNKLAWRGTASDSVSTDKFEPKRITRGINKILKKFPPR